MTWVGQHWDFWEQPTHSSLMLETMAPTWEIVPSFLDNPEGILSSFLETEIGSMISVKTPIARFMAAVYASPFCAMLGMEPSHALFAYSPVLLQLSPDLWREVFLLVRRLWQIIHIIHNFLVYLRVNTKQLKLHHFSLLELFFAI